MMDECLSWSTRQTAKRQGLLLGKIAVAFTAGALLAAHVAAQLTGNPKGTSAPTVQGGSAKAPATRRTDAGQRPGTGAVEAAQGAAAARTPGGGTAGRLTGRHPQGEGPVKPPAAPPPNHPAK